MNAITKERIELFIKNPLENGLTRGEQMELARIALASLEAEAVAYIIQDAQDRGRGRPGFLSFDASISDEDINEYEISVTPLYAAPQLPQPAVVVSESQSKKLFDEWSGGDGALGELMASGVPDEFISMLKEFSLATWEACREALLQHHAPFIVTSDHRMMEMHKAEDIGAVAAMLQGAEPVTDNTNQQFESLSRGDK